MSLMACRDCILNISYHVSQYLAQIHWIPTCFPCCKRTGLGGFPNSETKPQVTQIGGVRMTSTTNRPTFFWVSQSVQSLVCHEGSLSKQHLPHRTTRNLSKIWVKSELNVHCKYLSIRHATCMELLRMTNTSRFFLENDQAFHHDRFGAEMLL